MTKFKGFNLSERPYRTRNFTCRDCSNVCRITEVRFSGESLFYYGSRCDRFNERLKEEGGLPDLFRRRNEVIFDRDGKTTSTEGGLQFAPHGTPRGRIGIPRALLMWELFPFFCEFFVSLGYEVVLSPETNQELVRTSVREAPPTACLPVKVVHGHVEALLAEGIDILFIPALIDAAHPYTRTKDPPAPKLGLFQPIIDRILKDDEQAPRKQRHTAAQIFRRLRDEHGYIGGYEQVRRYVGKHRRCQRETFIPLVHDPGRAEEASFALYRSGRQQHAPAG